MRVTTAALFALTLSIGLATAPAVVEAGGSLVNVHISRISTGDILSNNNVDVDVAAQTAVYVCGLQIPVAAVAYTITQTGTFTCTSGDQILQAFVVNPTPVW
jgi:hypothetical protein